MRIVEGMLGLKLMAAAPAFGAPCDVKTNLAAILCRVKEAKQKGAELLLLPQLCLTAQSGGDILAQPLLLDAAAHGAMKIAEASEGLLCVFGLPVMSGGRLYSLMLAARDGQFIACWQKPLQARFRDAENFSAEPAPLSFDIGGQTVPVYHDNPLSLPGREDILLGLSMFGSQDSAAAAEKMARRGIHLALFPSAEPALASSAKARIMSLAQASWAGCLCLYANAGSNESSTDFVYDGMALIAYRDNISALAKPFSLDAAFAAYPFVSMEAVFSKGQAGEQKVYPFAPRYGSDRDQAFGDDLVYPFAPSIDKVQDEASVPDLAFPYAPPEGLQRVGWCRDALEIGAQALATRLRRIGAKCLTLGISGGLDSAMALMFACRAFGILGFDIAGILPFALPGPGSSAHTRHSARDLVEALGLTYREIDIAPSIQLHLKEIGHSGRPDAAFENAQARERTQILMDLANMHDGLMLGPGDMSELALGFTTYGGDHMSMYNPNAGLYKSAIRMMIDQAASDAQSAGLRDCLRAILATPISPELLPSASGEIVQRTEEIVGPYELIDFYLYHFLHKGHSSQELLGWRRRLLAASIQGKVC
ncbi:MAG: NAD(+) synthase [Clostridiales bacterium]|nr:NAD(+) synthase [Clostridiales bacterium]